MMADGNTMIVFDDEMIGILEEKLNLYLNPFGYEAAPFLVTLPLSSSSSVFLIFVFVLISGRRLQCFSGITLSTFS
jgi:hypothetical protein